MAEPRKPNLNEIATTANGRDITRGFVDGLPWLDPTDPVWREAGGWLTYEGLLKDDQVATCFAQRRMAVVSRPWTVEPGDASRLAKKAADLVRQTLDEIGWDSITDHMLHARHYGFAVAEVLWQLTPEGVRVAAIKPRDRRRFVFAPDGQLKLLTSHAWQGEPLPERCFWVASVGASHADEPYGRGLAHALYGPVWMKRQGAKFWGVFLEKFGMPTVVGKFHDGASEAERAKLLEAAQAVMSQAGIILPEGVTLELLEASRGGQAGYEAWMHYWDAAIAKVILGQTMTTDNGSSRAQAQVHWDVRQDIVAADADLIDATASATWVRWLVEYNYPGAPLPRVWRDMDEAEDVDLRAERDVKLAGIGIRLTPEAVQRVYGEDYVLEAPGEGERGKGEGETPAPTPGDTAEHAEPDATPDTPDAQAARLARDAAPALAGLIDQVGRLVDAADTAEDLQASLLAAYGHLDTDELTRIMALAFAAAELAGMLEAHQETGDA